MSRYALSTQPVEEKQVLNRNQAENRAKWMAFIYDEMVKAGVEDAEGILRRAVARTGDMMGDAFLKLTDGKTSPADWRDAFFHDIGLQSFVPVCTEVTDEACTVDFHYCALVNCWEKLGYDDETISKFCSIAMECDHTAARKFGMELDLQKTIADHCECCRLHFKKV